MKRANMKLNFQNDTINIFDENIPLITTSSGHYAIPIMKAKQLINNLNRESDMSLTLTMTNDKDNHNYRSKITQTICTPKSRKTATKNAGEPWSGNQNLVEEIKNVSNNRPTCKKYKKVPPRPVVGLPMVTESQEVVAMDLNFYDSKILLHLVDHCM